MNRIEALKAAFEIAGPNVTAEEHIQYAEFLLKDENVIVLENRITAEDTQSICGDPREYVPNYYTGLKVRAALDEDYPAGTIALDYDGDVYYKETDGSWSAHSHYDGVDFYPNITIYSIANSYEAVVVA